MGGAISKDQNSELRKSFKNRYGDGYVNFMGRIPAGLVAQNQENAFMSRQQRILLDHQHRQQLQRQQQQQQGNDGNLQYRLGRIQGGVDELLRIAGGRAVGSTTGIAPHDSVSNTQQRIGSVVNKKGGSHTDTGAGAEARSGGQATPPSHVSPNVQGPGAPLTAQNVAAMNERAKSGASSRREASIRAASAPAGSAKISRAAQGHGGQHPGGAGLAPASAAHRGGDGETAVSQPTHGPRALGLHSGSAVAYRSQARANLGWPH